MSEAQEAAQLLAGTELPRIVLEPLFHGVEFSGSVGGVVNFTPYDAFLEKVCVKWQLTLGMDHLALKQMNFFRIWWSKTLSIVNCCFQRIGFLYSMCFQNMMNPTSS